MMHLEGGPLDVDMNGRGAAGSGLLNREAVHFVFNFVFV